LPSIGTRDDSASWLIPGNASNSAMMAMTGSPLPWVATNAVGIPATPDSISNPSALSAAWISALLLVSW
jgi:hypothetical protein